MATSTASAGFQCHLRSISLPSRLHPQSTKVEAELNKLKTWELSLVSAVPTSAETIRIGLVGLAELYNCVEELVDSPLAQQAFLQHQHGELVEEALEGSIALLDSVSTARDLLLLMKQQIQELQSTLRRRGGDFLIVESNIRAYTCCRKKVKKEAAKSLRELKHMEEKIGSSSLLLGASPYLPMVVRILREVTSITISVLRSLLLFLVAPPSEKPKGWSLISKLVLVKPVTSARGHKVFNEMGGVDDALNCLHGGMKGSDAKYDLQQSRRRLQALDAGIEGLEGGLDCLFRRLIQTRVTLLNVLA
ncbi:hypothetical protein NMG60_11007771 [Bertholletia excelsa]